MPKNETGGALQSLFKGWGLRRRVLTDRELVEATIDAYNQALNHAEIPPNGDDYNDLQDAILTALVDGKVPVIQVKESGR